MRAVRRGLGAALRAVARPFRWPFAGRRRRRAWARGILLASALAIVGTPTGARVLSPAQQAARGYMFHLASWEVANFGSKWLHRLGEILRGQDPSEDRGRLDRYLELNAEINRVRGELDRAAAQRPAGSSEVEALQRTVDELVAERRSLRDDVEEYLEGAVDNALDALDLGELGPFTWPPVDFRLDPPPRVLVTSPRDHIERQESVLIEPDIGVPDMERIETALRDRHDLSAAVLGTGGVATFPTVIPEGRDLLSTLEVAAHEWLHAYLFFKPLGQAYWNNQDMTTLNETLADIFGREVGRDVYARVSGEPAPEPAPEDRGSDPTEFGFRNFMRATRLRTDELLAAGDVRGAEAYMEQRRVELQDHGFYIRVLNQAYFAFNGSYGESPSSVSPIAGQLEELRGRVRDVGALVKLVQGVGSYDDFLALLGEDEEPGA